VILTLRRQLIGRYMLMAMLCFAFGPGIAVHTLSDTHHLAAHDHEPHGFDVGEHQGEHFDSQGTCEFEHEHDQSHAGGASVACLAAPQLMAMGSLSAEPVRYVLSSSQLPDGTAPPGPGKPPRTPSHI